ncbi:MAG: glycosyltransferase family 2 protein [Vicingaceae bacterium]
MPDNRLKIVVIIPAFNEENSVGKVIADLPVDMITEVVVVNNNSNDNTSVVASRAGATVIEEPIAGYGRACLRGLEYAKNRADLPDIMVFIDADYSDYPEQMPELVNPIALNIADLVIGSRSMGNRESGSMTFPQRFGNRLATFLIRHLFKHKFTDLGPFRAIRYSSLTRLEMEDQDYGWTVEMQVKGIKKGLRCLEVPVDYRKRIGFSKISGTVKGTFLAGYKIIRTIFKYA